jgi:hypothetical protein
MCACYWQPTNKTKPNQTKPQTQTQTQTKPNQPTNQPTMGLTASGCITTFARPTILKGTSMCYFFLMEGIKISSQLTRNICGTHKRFHARNV